MSRPAPSPLAAVRVIGAGAALTCSAALVALYATTIPADVSQAAEHAPKPLTVTSAPATGITTFAPIFPTPTEDQPQPWSEDDGPISPHPVPSPRVVADDPRSAVPTSSQRDRAPRVVDASDTPAATSVEPRKESLPSPTPQPPLAAQPTVTPTPDQPHPVLVLVNNARAEAGCPPVTDDPDMTAFAQQWAQQQAADQLMRHSDGPYAENVAAGYPTGAEVMSAWLSSSGHRGNIETCEFTRHGIGSAVGDDGLTYWTQVFGT